MRETKKLFKKFYKDKDDYMRLNSNFVCESLIKFEQNHLDGFYNDLIDYPKEVVVV